VNATWVPECCHDIVLQSLCVIQAEACRVSHKSLSKDVLLMQHKKSSSASMQ